MHFNLLMIYPMCAMVLLTSLVLLVMFLGRVQAVRTGKVKVGYFKTYTESTGPVPENLVKAQRHFSNLFEVPVLFYIGCVVAMVVPILTLDVVIWAWIFVLARLFHALVHMGPNQIRPRMLSFLVGWIAIWGLWITIFVKVVATSAL